MYRYTHHIFQIATQIVLGIKECEDTSIIKNIASETTIPIYVPYGSTIAFYSYYK
jgi:hypothetical protein